MSVAGVKTFFKKNATPIVLTIVALTAVMLVWRLAKGGFENFAAPLPSIVSQIQTQYANEHARFKAALMLLKPSEKTQSYAVGYVNMARAALNGPLKISVYDPKDDRAQGPTVAPGAITYPWINSKGTAVVAKDDIEDNVAWAIAHYAGVVPGSKGSPRRVAAYQYLTANIPRAPAAKPAIAVTPAKTPAIATADAKKIAADKAAAAAAVAAKAAAAKALAAKVKIGETLTGTVSGKQAPPAGGKLYSYTITYSPKGKLPGQKFVFQTPNPNMPATVKLTMDQDGDVYKLNNMVYGKYNPLG